MSSENNANKDTNINKDNQPNVNQQSTSDNANQTGTGSDCHHNVEGFRYVSYTYKDSSGKRDHEEHFRDISHPDRNFDKEEHVPPKQQIAEGQQTKSISDQEKTNTNTNNQNLK
jgi:hypothetical protein